MKIGVLSDTHNFLDPRVPELLAGVDYILHAGDIGLPRILLQLEQIAPVTAVTGNTDDPGFGYRLTELTEVGQTRFLIQHIVNPHHVGEPLSALITRARPHAVVFGHTHKPFCERLGGILFFNPGYAGKTRFGMPRSIAVLHCGENELRPEYFSLP